jgi:hypothetical protein
MQVERAESNERQVEKNDFFSSGVKNAVVLMSVILNISVKIFLFIGTTIPLYPVFFLHLPSFTIYTLC